ncbi:MAG: acetolactate synthase large subunit [Nitrospiraceae bacterium]|nr:acetolactate synthase large subunit [Nitrospiraceae bacterium]
MKTSGLFVSCLENEGVEYVFGIPGEENIELLYALKKSGKIKFVTTRDERGASFMATAWGRLCGRPGVCLSTLGPGAINLLPGVADAFLDFSPVIAITAQKSLSETFREAHQYIDVVSIYKPVTKWGASIRAKNVPEIVRKAFRVAMAEKPGPVHLEMPEDVACLPAEGEPMPPALAVYPEPSGSAVQAALDMVQNAANPVVIAGNGVIRAGASAELLKFLNRFRLPAAATFMAMGAVPASERLFISTVGLQQKDYISCGLERADLIITVGFDPVEFSPQYWKGVKKHVIHISATPAETDVAYQSLELVGDIKKTLSTLARKCSFTRAEPDYYLKIRQGARGLLSGADTGYPLKPLRIVRELRGALGKKDILVSDVGAHKIWISRFYEALSPNTVLISNGLASMGFAIPSAIAARLVHPERKVVAAVGDGGFLMTAAEIETAVRLGVSMVVLVFNDGAYGLIEWKERVRYRQEFFTGFGNPDFVKFAEAFGARGYRVEKEGELAGILKDALGREGVSIIDCPVDYGENMELTSKLGSLICPA